MSRKESLENDANVKLPVRFTDKPITGWGGLRVMAAWFTKVGVREEIERNFQELAPGSNRGYAPWELMVSFMVALYTGAWRFVHIDQIRWDEPVQAMFGLKRVPSPSSLARFFRKFSWRRNFALWPRWNRVFMEKARARFNPEGEIVDLDSSVFTRFGKQEGAEVGYNPQKRGRASHHPIFAVAAGARWILHLWLRGGRSGSSSRVIEFIQEMLNGMPEWFRIKGFRMDSGFFSGPVFDFLEGKGISYTCAARCLVTVRRAVLGIAEWTTVSRGIEIGEATYQASDWKRARRVVAIRQTIAERPTAQGKLFALAPGYRYQVLATDLLIPAIEVWRHYNGRADVENRIQEWKDDFFMDGFAMKKFFATEASLWLVAMTFNLTEWFKTVMIESKRPRLMTLRLRNFLCGGWLGWEKGRHVLRLNARPELRDWIRKSLIFLETGGVPIASQ